MTHKEAKHAPVFFTHAVIQQENLAYASMLATIFFRSWEKEGLCASVAEAEETINHLNTRFAYMVFDTEKRRPGAVIHTQPARVLSVENLCKQYPLHRRVVSASMANEAPDNPNVQLCFSITALSGYRVITEDGREMSLAKMLLTGLPIPPHIYKVGYSRFSDVPKGTRMIDFLANNLDNPRALGPVGMHMAMGGLPVAILPTSRPEDRNGGGGNVLVFYPKNPSEERAFAKINLRRAETKTLPVYRTPEAFIFTDSPLGIPLFDTTTV